MRIVIRLTVLVAASLLLVSAAASARPISWGGNGFNDLGPASVLLSVENGRAKVTNVQMVLACTDAEDGTESSGAFSARFRTAVSLRANHYAFDFSANSGGRLGRVRIDGVLRSNGTGTARVRIQAQGLGERGEVVDRCSGETHIRLRRGR
jgi:hypothetical protein